MAPSLSRDRTSDAAGSEASAATDQIAAPGRGRPARGLDEGMDDKIDIGMVQKARKKVMRAIKVPATALRLAHLCDTNLDKRKR